MNIEKLKGLLAAVPSAELRSGHVLGDKPGILAGVSPVCRLPEGPVGEAYGALMVEAVNALPALIQASELSAGSPEGEPSPYSKELRERIEQQISTVLGMRPGAKGSNSIWSRLIWTNIEPHLVGPLPAMDESALSADGNLAPLAERIRKERSEAVLQFTCFMTAHLGTMPIEGEADVTKLFERWEVAHNMASE
jgi:hypothetical protein